MTTFFGLFICILPNNGGQNVQTFQKIDPLAMTSVPLISCPINYGLFFQVKQASIFGTQKSHQSRLGFKSKQYSGVILTTRFKFSHQVSVIDNCDRWRQSFIIQQTASFTLSIFHKSLLTSYELQTDGV